MNTRRTTPLLLAALAGTLVSTASASVIGWNNPAGGAWYATSNWNPQSAPGPGDTASITMAGTYDIGVGNGSPASVGSISLLNPNARLLFDNGTDFTVLAGGIVNNGTILINSDTIGSDRLLFGVDQELISGTGAIVLNAPNYQSYDGAYLSTPQGVTAILGAGQTLRGNGNVYGSFNNKGTIGGGTIAGPQIRGTVQQTEGGRIYVGSPGQSATVLDGTVIGGTIETANNGFVFGRGTGNLQGVTITAGSTFCIDNNNDFGINGAGITNNGTIVVNSDQIASDRLVFRTNNAALAGTGVVNLNAPNYQSYDGAYLNTASGVTGYIGAGQTIQGNGNIYGSFVNQGTIGGGTIEGPQIRGTVQQSNGGRIFVSGQHASILDGTVVGGTIETANNGFVFGRGTGNLQGVTITAGSTFCIDNNNDFGINGAGITNNGTIVVNSDQGASDRLVFRTNATLGGTGVVNLNAPNYQSYDGAYLNTAPGITATIGAGQTIQGNGNIYGSYINQGTIGGGSIEGPQIRGTVQQNNGGRIFVSGQHASILDGTVINGTIETANGGIVFARGTGSLQGVTITTGSSFFVDNNNDFGINSAGITNNGNIVINSDQGSADRLLFRTDTAIQGVGSVFLNANPSDYNSAQLNTVGTSFGTLASGQTIRGRGTLNGNFLIDGRISPGIPPGSVIGGGRTNTIRANGGSVTLDSGSAVDIELASAGVWDSFEGNSSKSIQPGVAMTVAFLNGYAPGGTAWFDVITAIGSSVSGRFDTLSAPLVPSGPMHLVYFSDRVRLVVCYANCDGSTTAPILNVNDFTCFLNSFAAGDPYANCDASTTPPVLNILDFTCFLNKFAAGCT